MLPDAVLLQIERQQRMRDGARVRGIEIEMRGEDRQALRVGRLDGDHAAALSRCAQSRTISGRRAGGRCSTTWAQKMPSSEASGRPAR